MKTSILQTKKECYFCRTLYDRGLDLPEDYIQPLHKHHIMHGTANRKQADMCGLWVWLCPYHHTISRRSVHQSHETDVWLIKKGQQAYEHLYGHEMWMKTFLENYL